MREQNTARFILRIDVEEDAAERTERALKAVAESLKGARLSRTDFEPSEAEGYMRRLGGRQIVPASGGFPR
jgi:hypothetical protein